LRSLREVYRDRERQKIAVREAVRRFRSKGITQGITVIPSDVIPSPVIPVIPLVTIENVKKVAAGLVSNQDWRKPKTPASVRRFGESPEVA
jgi:hypothetical protein